MNDILLAMVIDYNKIVIDAKISTTISMSLLLSSCKQADSDFKNEILSYLSELYNQFDTEIDMTIKMQDILDNNIKYHIMDDSVENEQIFNIIRNMSMNNNGRSKEIDKNIRIAYNSISRGGIKFYHVKKDKFLSKECYANFDKILDTIKNNQSVLISEIIKK